MREQVILGKMIMMYALYQTSTVLDFYSASSPTKQSAGRHFDLIGQIILNSSHPIFLLHLIREATSIYFIVFGLTRPRGFNPRSTTLDTRSVSLK